MRVTTLKQIKDDVISYLGHNGNTSVITRLNERLLLAVNDAVNEVAHMLNWQAASVTTVVTIAPSVVTYIMPDNLSIARIESIHVKKDNSYWRDLQRGIDYDHGDDGAGNNDFERYELEENSTTGRTTIRLHPEQGTEQTIKIKYTRQLNRLTDDCDVCEMPAELVKLYATYLMKVAQGADDAQSYMARFNAILGQRKAEFSTLPDVIKKKHV